MSDRSPARTLSPTSAPARARARVRAAMTEEILDAGRSELAEQGAPALSLRAVARRLGMVPSALYRYFPSRDSLLTALIIEAYDELGAVADAADRAAPQERPLERWLSLCGAVRAWGSAHPHRWALLYGSPVPGYAAPDVTVESASAVPRVLARIMAASSAGGVAPPSGASGSDRVPALPFPPAGFDQVLAPLRDALLPGFPPEVLVAALMAWTSLVGTVSLELFGHYEGGTTDFGAVFTYAMEVAGRMAGLW